MALTINKTKIRSFTDLDHAVEWANNCDIWGKIHHGAPSSKQYDCPHCGPYAEHLNVEGLEINRDFSSPVSGGRTCYSFYLGSSPAANIPG